MIFDFKGKYKLSNSLSVFNYYKKFTGTSLEKDLRKINYYQKFLEKEDVTPEELEKFEVDPIEILVGIYYAMRCAAEQKDLDLEETVKEIEISDLTDGTFELALSKLLGEDNKKKQHRKFFRNKTN